MLKDKNGIEVKVGDKIKAVISNTENHILTCHDGFRVDLSFPVTVRIDKEGHWMAGWISLNHYQGREFEIIEKLEAKE